MDAADDVDEDEGAEGGGLEVSTVWASPRSTCKHKDKDKDKDMRQ